MSKSGFAKHLLSSKMLTQTSIDSAEEHAELIGLRFESAILERGELPESTLLASYGQFHHLPTVTGTQLRNAPTSVIRMISPRLARRYRLVPFALDGKQLSIAVEEPIDLLLEDELRVLTGCRISQHATFEPYVTGALAKYYKALISPVHRRLLKLLISRHDANSSTSAPSSEPLQAPPSPSASSGGAAAPPGELWTPPTVGEHDRSAASEQLMAGARDSSEEVDTLIDSAPSSKSRDTAALEFSAEDLAMFPSLAASAAAPSSAEAAISADAPSIDDDTGFGSEEFVEEAIQQITSQDPSERLEEAAEVLQGAEMRDEIGDAILEYCAPFMSRAALFFVRGEKILGWRGTGPGIYPIGLRAVEIPTSEPSAFFGLLKGQEMWFGALPSMPRNFDLILGLGGVEPKQCLILPLAIRGKIVCLLYCDNGPDEPLKVPTGLLKRLLSKAALAFEVYILRNKIRRL